MIIVKKLVAFAIDEQHRAVICQASFDLMCYPLGYASFVKIVSRSSM